MASFKQVFKAQTEQHYTTKRLKDISKMDINLCSYPIYVSTPKIYLVNLSRGLDP